MGSTTTSYFSIQDISDKSGSLAGGVFGKLIGSIAGIILLVGILKASFYLTKVGHRSVLMRGGSPVLKRNGEWWLAASRTLDRWGLSTLTHWCLVVAAWRKRTQVGEYKVKRPGIRMKLPGWYDIEKVDVQRRRQKLDPFTADCPDGQRSFKADLITRVPCDDDGNEYHDYPALKVIHSYEADELFESFGGNVLMDLLENTPPEARNNRQQLNQLLNHVAGAEFERCAYLLEGVNLRQRSLTPIQKAINAFAPQPAPAANQSDTTDSGELLADVVELPHPLVFATAQLELVAEAELS